jgi:hypothetical protein
MSESLVIGLAYFFDQRFGIPVKISSLLLLIVPHRAFEGACSSAGAEFW